MKLIISLKIALSILLLAGTSAMLNAQASNIATLRLTREKVASVHYYLIQDSERKIFEAVLSGNLKAFQDSSQIHVFSPAELKEKLTNCEKIEIPTDIEGIEMNDTIYCAEPDAQYLGLLRRYTSRTSDHSVGLCYDYILGEITPVFFVSEVETRTVLSKDENLIISRLLDDLTGTATLHGDGTNVFALSDSILMNLAKPLYLAASSGKLKAYTSDSLHRTYTLEQIRNIGNNYCYIEIPVDENDPYSNSDSILRYEFDPQNISGLFIVEEWRHKGEKGKYKLLAVAPVYSPVVGDMTFPPVSMFYSHWRPAVMLLSKADQAYLQILIRYVRMQSLDLDKFGAKGVRRGIRMN